MYLLGFNDKSLHMKEVAYSAFLKGVGGMNFFNILKPNYTPVNILLHHIFYTKELSQTEI